MSRPLSPIFVFKAGADGTVERLAFKIAGLFSDLFVCGCEPKPKTGMLLEAEVKSGGRAGVPVERVNAAAPKEFDACPLC